MIGDSSHWFRNATSLRCAWHRVMSVSFGLVDQPVVLGVEDRVDGGEADVLVGAAVAGDVVRVEQLVVVGKVVPELVGRLGIAGDVVGIGARWPRRVEHRHGVVGDVDQELVAGAHGVREVDRRRRIAFDQGGAVVRVSECPVGAGVCITTCGKPCAPGMKLP